MPVDIDLTKRKPLLVKCAWCGHWIESTPEMAQQLLNYVYPPGQNASDARTLCDVCLKQVRDGAKGKAR